MESMVRRSVTRDDFDRADKLERLLKTHMTQVVDSRIRAVILTNVMATFNPYKCELTAFFLFQFRISTCYGWNSWDNFRTHAPTVLGPPLFASAYEVRIMVCKIP